MEINQYCFGQMTSSQSDIGDSTLWAPHEEAPGPLALLGHYERSSLFSLLGKVNRYRRENHYCALSFTLSERGLWLVRCKYKPPRRISGWRSKACTSIGTKIFRDGGGETTLEDLLQLIRHSFPGVEFQFLEIRLIWGGIAVHNLLAAPKRMSALSAP